LKDSQKKTGLFQNLFKPKTVPGRLLSPEKDMSATDTHLYLKPKWKEEIALPFQDLTGYLLEASWISCKNCASYSEHGTLILRLKHKDGRVISHHFRGITMVYGETYQADIDDYGKRRKAIEVFLTEYCHLTRDSSMARLK